MQKLPWIWENESELVVVVEFGKSAVVCLSEFDIEDFSASGGQFEPCQIEIPNDQFHSTYSPMIAYKPHLEDFSQIRILLKHIYWILIKLGINNKISNYELLENRITFTTLNLKRYFLSREGTVYHYCAFLQVLRTLYRGSYEKF